MLTIHLSTNTEHKLLQSTVFLLVRICIEMFVPVCSAEENKHTTTQNENHELLRRISAEERKHKNNFTAAQKSLIK